MTADAAHVAAVAEAFLAADWTNRYRRDLATVAVETLTPLIAAERDALAAENARLRAQVETLRHGVNHPYGGIDGCARCAIATTTTEDRPVPDHTDARALYFPADDHGNPTDCWHVQAGDYADEPDLVIVIEHAVSSEGKDRRESVAREVAALLNSRGGPMSDYFEQWEEALRNGLRAALATSEAGEES